RRGLAPRIAGLWVVRASGAAIQRSPKTMPTLSIEESQNLKSAAPKKGKAKSSAPRRGKATSATVIAKKAPRSAVSKSKQAAIAETLARLSAATIFELRGEWRRLHRAPPPMRLSRDLLMRGITYKLQERPLGGLSSSLRKLERRNLGSEASEAQKPAPS